MVTSGSWDLDKPWLVRYQFYLFEFIEGGEAASYKFEPVANRPAANWYKQLCKS